MALNSLAKTTKLSENENSFSEQNSTQTITYNIEDNKTTRNKGILL